MRARLVDIDFEDEFESDPDPTKWIKLWAAGYYKLINRHLRNEPIAALRALPNTTLFVQGFMRYARDHGLSKEDLLPRSHATLYRGIDFTAPTGIRDLSFMATSYERYVAEQFARRNGTIFMLNVAEIGPAVRGILIDQTVSEDFTESEITFMPGTLQCRACARQTDHLGNAVVPCQYREDTAWIAQLMEPLPPPATGGEAPRPRIDYRGKHIVWFRAIAGRPIDVFLVDKLPATHDGVRKYAYNMVRLRDASYDASMSFIPDVMDLEKTLRRDDLTAEERAAAQRRLDEHCVHRAVYDAQAGRIESLHAFAPRGLFAEIFDMAREPAVVAELERVLPGSGWLTTACKS
jgi:hypothetical protein